MPLPVPLSINFSYTFFCFNDAVKCLEKKRNGSPIYFLLNTMEFIITDKVKVHNKIREKREAVLLPISV